MEIENIEDVFSEGIMLMVHFRETCTRVNRFVGRRKRWLGIYILLALQSLSLPYLLDEVDAHLDSQNTDRLSRVLLSGH